MTTENSTPNVDQNLNSTTNQNPPVYQQPATPVYQQPATPVYQQPAAPVYQQSAPQVVIAKSPKSMGIAIALTIFFGPLGMFYSTVAGAIVMIIVNLIVGILTFGIGLLVTWPIDIIWTIVAVNSYNKKLMQGIV